MADVSRRAWPRGRRRTIDGADPIDSDGDTPVRIDDRGMAGGALTLCSRGADGMRRSSRASPPSDRLDRAVDGFTGAPSTRDVLHVRSQVGHHGSRAASPDTRAVDDREDNIPGRFLGAPGTCARRVFDPARGGGVLV